MPDAAAPPAPVSPDAASATAAPAVRPVRAGDLPAITRIYGHHVRHGLASFEEEAPDESEMGRRQAALLAQGYPYLVAELDGHVVGYGYVGPYRPRPAYRWTVENSIYLAPDRHGRGIGAALLAALIQAATARGYRQMVAVIGDTANTPSIRLHAKLGFRLVGSLEGVGFKHGRWVDSVLMQRALGPGTGTPPQGSGLP